MFIVDIAVTERVNHAKEIARELDVTLYDALVCASGDGLVHEVINGFALRPDALDALRLPLAVIPSGAGFGSSLGLPNSLSRKKSCRIWQRPVHQYCWSSSSR